MLEVCVFTCLQSYICTYTYLQILWCLICIILVAGLAYFILEHYKNLLNYVNVDGETPLHVLARKPNLFKSCSQLGFYESIIYHCKKPYSSYLALLYIYNCANGILLRSVDKLYLLIIWRTNQYIIQRTPRLMTQVKRNSQKITRHVWESSIYYGIQFPRAIKVIINELYIGLVFSSK